MLTSRIAVRDSARAEVHNKLTPPPFARGHVTAKKSCRITASPPRPHRRSATRRRITHEAAIGSVDTRQLETLMSRGLTEDDAVELIIQGLLS